MKVNGKIFNIIYVQTWTIRKSLLSGYTSKNYKWNNCSELFLGERQFMLECNFSEFNPFFYYTTFGKAVTKFSSRKAVIFERVSEPNPTLGP